MKKLLFFVLLALLSSCSKGYGEKIENENVIVFYLDKAHKKEAQKLLDFWVEEQFNSDKKQYLRLLGDAKNNYSVQLIASPNFDPKTISFEEIKLFTELKYRLDTEVFKPQTCKIVICDGTFRPIYTPVN